MSRFGPSRGELRFRLWASLAGLGMVVATVALRGIPSGPALVEVIGIAGLFFAGTALWSARALRGARNGQSDPNPGEEAGGDPPPRG